MTCIEKRAFGRLNTGEEVELYCLKNCFLTAEISTLGAAMVSLKMPDESGRQTDVILGLMTPQDYWNQRYTSMGKTIGRHVNRIRNAEFELNGKTYKLASNFLGKHHIHGGDCGFEQKNWKAATDETGVTMNYISADGEEGYPGKLSVTVKFSLEERSLRIHFQASSDEDTIVNMGSQIYFNLDGHHSGSVEDQRLKINGDWITEMDEDFLPTGRLLPVAKTSLDFRHFKPIGNGTKSVLSQVQKVGGLDHNYVMNEYDGTLHKNLEMEGKKSGIHMSLYSDLPGLQVYSGNNLNGTLEGKEGYRYEKRAGICFVPQFFPDAIHIKGFQSPILKKGETYIHDTVYAFNHRSQTPMTIIL